MIKNLKSDLPEDLGDALFDPFRRKDRFGLIGTERLGVWDRLIVILFSVFVLPVRVALAALGVLGCYVVCVLYMMLPERNRAKVLVPLGKMFARMCLFACGVRVKWRDLSTDNSFPCAIVSNHVSWLDILVHMAFSFPSFVAKDTTKNIPIIGKIR